MHESVLEVVDSNLLKPSFEALKKAARARKSVLDDAGAAARAALGQQQHGASPQQAQRLDELASSLQGLKRKLEEVSRAEADEAQRCKSRLDHLAALCAPKDSVVGWNKQRLDRLLVDHLNRARYSQTASYLATASNITDLVDSHIFKDAKKVIDALRRHDCSEALAWCSEQRARLKKAKSKLEFALRVQEFIELVRQKRKLEAIAYAREHLAPWAAQYMEEFQRAVTSLVFPLHTTCAAYRALLDPAQWGVLEEMFMRELYRMHQLPPASLLVVHLEAGLSALKMPASAEVPSSREDPLHLPSFQALAEPLPCAKHVRSKLLCSVTRSIMSDANPPVVLPNGYVYSQAAIDMIAQEHGGRVVCPVTGATYSQDELRRAFIV